MNTDKPVIHVQYSTEGGHSGSYATAELANFNYNSVLVDWNLLGSDTLLHELAHVLQLRNSIHLNSSLSEGFAELMVDILLGQMNYPGAQSMEHNLYGFVDGKSVSDFEQGLLYASDAHNFSFYFAETIYEKYGFDKIKEIMSLANAAARKKNGVIYGGASYLTEEELFLIEKEATSQTIIQDCVDFVSNRTLKDLTINQANTWYPYFENQQGYAISFADWYTLKGTQTIDYSKLIEFAQKMMGEKFRGLALDLIYAEDAQYMDINGTVLRSGYSGKEFVKGAVSVRITAKDGISQPHLYYREMFHKLSGLSGTCGNTAKWELKLNKRTGNYQLVISGTGATYDYVASYSQPWASYLEKIESVVINEGTTTVGKSLLDECKNAKEIKLADSIQEIWWSAFGGCSSITQIKLPEGIKFIANDLFGGCYALKKVVVPKSVSVVECGAFGASGINEIVFEGDCPVFDDNALNFLEWWNGKRISIYYPCTNKTWRREIVDDAIARSEIEGNITIDLLKKHVSSKGIKIEKKPTCTNSGNTVFKCTICSETVREVIPAVGHDWRNNKIVQHPTKTKVGKLEKICTKCGKKKYIVIGLSADPLRLSISKTTLYTGNKKHTIKVKAIAKGNSKVIWTTSNKKVATVKKGKITAVGKGTATITAKANGVKEKVKVTVKNPTIKLKDSKKKNLSSVKIEKGKSVSLTIDLTPKKSGVKLEKLSQKTNKLASVRIKNGTLVIKAKKKGKFALRMKSGNAAKKLKVTIN